MLGWAAGLTPLGAASYGGTGHDAPRNLLRAESLLLAPGGLGAVIEAWLPTSGGAPDARLLLRYDDGLARALTAAQPVDDLLLTAARRSGGAGGGLEVWRSAPTGQNGTGQLQLGAVTQLGGAAETGDLAALDLSDLAVVDLPAMRRVLALSPAQNSLYS
ncbi:hypothetical protein [Alloyangia pacifica]|uniref:hypothetical protein n=1 Tax=Alloyangia pacifica TaxID=311180 RepID=UPI001CD3520A|nr:hypothetical protein [Alloyangia pacifica]MCA0998654.1 hypothetical protein [Alloyangia pacifica]